MTVNQPSTITDSYRAGALRALAASIVSGHAKLQTRDDFIGVAREAYITNEFKDYKYVGFMACPLVCGYLDRNPIKYDYGTDNKILRATALSGIVLIKESRDLNLRFHGDDVQKAFDWNDDSLKELDMNPRMFDIVTVARDNEGLGVPEIVNLLRKIADNLDD